MLVYEPYAITTWRSGRPRLTISKDGASSQDFIVEAMDLKKHTARLVAAGGANEVQVWRTTNGLHLLETATLGNIILTTISELKTKEGFVVVTSRHTEGFGVMLPQQYSGICTVLE